MCEIERETYAILTAKELMPKYVPNSPSAQTLEKKIPLVKI